MTTVRVAVPRKGRPLEAVLQQLAEDDWVETADSIISTLRYEKALTKGNQHDDRNVYERLSAHSELSEPHAPEYTLFRDSRAGMPRRLVFDSVTVPRDGPDLRLIGREEPLRALRKHEFALGFDSADLVLETLVTLESDPLDSLAAVNDRIDPVDTDVRIHTGLGDTVYHTLLGRPELCDGVELDREFVRGYEGDLCISPRYERLVEAILGTRATDGVEFTYPDPDTEEEAAIADAGLGVYLTVTGSTAREHGLVVGESLFPSETVLLSNRFELDETGEAVASSIVSNEIETAIPNL